MMNTADYLDDEARTALRTQTRDLLREDRADTVRVNLAAARARGDDLAVAVIEEVVEERRAMAELKRSPSKERRAELNAWHNRNAIITWACLALAGASYAAGWFDLFAGVWPALFAGLMICAAWGVMMRPLPRRLRGA